MAKAKARRGHSLLWEITHAQSSVTSFLFGTMHTRQGNVHTWLPLLVPYMRECKLVSTEFSMGQQESMPVVTVTASKNWWARLTPRQQEQVRRQLVKLDLGDIEDYRHLAPLLLVQAITSELLGKEAALPLDFALAYQAREMGLRWEGIETLDEQWDVLKGLSTKEQCRQLVDLVCHFSKFSKKLRKQVRWYLDQDIQQLYKDARKSLKKLRKPMLLSRNKIMAMRIADMSAQEPCFHAIGAAHLAGGKGVLSLLKKQGYLVKPIYLRLESTS